MNTTRRLGQALGAVMLIAVAAISQASFAWSYTDPDPGSQAGPVVVPVPPPDTLATSTSSGLSIWAVVAAVVLAAVALAATLLIARHVRRGQVSRRSHVTSH